MAMFMVRAVITTESNAAPWAIKNPAMAGFFIAQSISGKQVADCVTLFRQFLLRGLHAGTGEVVD